MRISPEKLKAIRDAERAFESHCEDVRQDWVQDLAWQLGLEYETVDRFWFDDRGRL